jgi:hypothetical protein
MYLNFFGVGVCTYFTNFWCMYFTAIWYTYLIAIWYTFPVLVWFTKKNLSTLVMFAPINGRGPQWSKFVRIGVQIIDHFLLPFLSASKLYVYFDLVADKINSVHHKGGKMIVYCRYCVTIDFFGRFFKIMCSKSNYKGNINYVSNIYKRYK